MFFNTWADLGRILVVGVCAYVALIVLLRISGKRTLSKMNAFDLVVTVALGSTLATILLSKDVALAEGILAFALLVGLQYVIAWLTVRSRAVGDLVKAEPALLFYQGCMLHEALMRERVTEGEVRAAVRNQNIASMDVVKAVVLETDGTFSVLPQTDKAATALTNVRGYASRSNAA
ncbi:MAG: DUF421 domain-containing protein [Chloroflexaceae bacterium]|nr:DUF421 domain-containing protein [Chloroflexaceae bacterium]NJL34290.1 DUF421 domain-containing protein [Chloroflexaceae bacterium]NJO04585.1 DUF421 domain-containing protein [Chloroflexaceae bacterium]